METRATISSSRSATSSSSQDGAGRPEEAAAVAAGEEAPRASDLMVSLRAEVPEALLASMRLFIEQHPNWDQYRLFQAAVAGFLVQNGVQSRNVTRCYLANLFPAQGRFRCG